MDVFGEALLDQYRGTADAKLWLYNSYGHPEEMPVDVFFRNKNEMPELELLALDRCRGRILDIGAGVGSHALILQERGEDVTAIEISKTACEIMMDRGVDQVIHEDILNFSGEKFDTLLLLMNGVGLAGSIPGLRKFLEKSRELLMPNGQLIFDSSDIAYLYDDLALPAGKYYGEISYQYEYRSQLSDWFNWLYIDPILLNQIAAEEGWKMELLMDDEMDQYLVRFTVIS
jgi:SAM-dependent methyltransferase